MRSANLRSLFSISLPFPLTWVVYGFWKMSGSSLLDILYPAANCSLGGFRAEGLIADGLFGVSVSFSKYSTLIRCWSGSSSGCDKVRGMIFLFSFRLVSLSERNYIFLSVKLSALYVELIDLPRVIIFSSMSVTSCPSENLPPRPPSCLVRSCIGGTMTFSQLEPSRDIPLMRCSELYISTEYSYSSLRCSCSLSCNGVMTFEAL